MVVGMEVVGLGLRRRHHPHLYHCTWSERQGKESEEIASPLA